MITAQEALELEKATAAQRRREAQARISCAKERFPTFFKTLEAQIDAAACSGDRSITLSAHEFFDEVDYRVFTDMYRKYLAWLGFTMQRSGSKNFKDEQLTFNW